MIISGSILYSLSGIRAGGILETNIVARNCQVAVQTSAGCRGDAAEWRLGDAVMHMSWDVHIRRCVMCALPTSRPQVGVMYLIGNWVITQEMCTSLSVLRFCEHICSLEKSELQRYGRRVCYKYL
jgi:hypothetical protein